MHPFASLAFSGTWRDYQARVLEELDAHLGDARLHVVAAPGSGKTVLGLEVMRRIGRPAIVLAPSIAIRNQWVERLRAMFVPPGAALPDWISTAIGDPRALTVITYQALHAAIGDAEASQETADDSAEAETAPPGSFAALAAHYRTLGPATLLLDEAHHLRREWWRALTALQAALGEPRIVALTATPPYDVERVEWQRYEALCGEMDAEIPAAELVRNGDLCPHQDYLHLSLPTAPEGALFAAHREGIAALVSALHADSGFLALVLAHPWLTDPDAHEEALLEAPESLSAMIVFAAFAGAAAPARPLALLGVGRSEIPPMSLDWLERLLDFMIFDRPEDFASGQEGLKALKAELRRLGLIEGRRVTLREDRHFYATLAGSLAKIGSIVAIAEAEAEALGPELRLVVLADYVRAADMPRRPGDEILPAKL
ncbi:MAG TPA: DEAD/DEAH box helicase family protein, partial [Allosphingosinicella sp.]|nr:DEAD/DEAH box helicase family protein [Allosphingosinicella sp.]